MKKKTMIVVVIVSLVWIVGLWAIYQFLWINPQSGGSSYGANTVRTRYIPGRFNADGEFVEIGFLEGRLPHISVWTALCAIAAVAIIRRKEKKVGSLDI